MPVSEIGAVPVDGARHERERHVANAAEDEIDRRVGRRSSRLLGLVDLGECAGAGAQRERQEKTHRYIAGHVSLQSVGRCWSWRCRRGPR